jgi:YD repeat-containing protein
VVCTTNYGLDVDGSSYAGHSSWARTTFKAYDDRGRVVAEFLAPNANNVRPVTRYQYDLYNNVTAKQTPEANSWNYSYTYNAAGTLLTATDPKGGIAKNYLDARGNVAAQYGHHRANRCRHLRSRQFGGGGRDRHCHRLCQEEHLQRRWLVVVHHR